MELLRLAELLAGLSMVADVVGLEPGEAARASLVAVALTGLLGEGDPSDVYYVTLLQHIGCTAYAHAAAALLGGDEIAVKRAAVRTDFASPRTSRGRTFRTSPRQQGFSPACARPARRRCAGDRSCWVTAARTARSRRAPRCGFGLPDRVQRALLEIYEQWNGKGGPNGLGGEAVALPARIAQVAITAALFHGIGGRYAEVQALRRRAGSALDPRLVELACRRTGDVLAALDVPDVLAAALDAEQEPVTRISELSLDRVCRAFGEAVDLKTPLHHTTGTRPA